MLCLWKGTDEYGTLEASFQEKYEMFEVDEKQVFKENRRNLQSAHTR